MTPARRAHGFRRIGPKPPKPRLEKHEQGDGVALLRSLGAQVYVLGHARPRGDRPSTMQTPGLPDVEAFLPRPRYRAGQFHPRRFLKWEVKRPRKATIRAEQAAYRQLCLDADIAHVMGDLNTLIAWLVDGGYLLPSQLPHDRQPQEG